jgi:hypothetical protein
MMIAIQNLLKVVSVPPFMILYVGVMTKLIAILVKPSVLTSQIIVWENVSDYTMSDL